jgi:hypothetical protein
MHREVFDSCVRSAGDFAGFFEYDGETSYFYLSDLKRADGQRIVDHIHVHSGQHELRDADILVSWNDAETRVGLFIGGELWAVFDLVTKEKFGGDWRLGSQAKIPQPLRFTLPH